MCSRRWQRQRTSCEKLGARNAKVSSGASRAAQSKKRRNEVRRRNGRRKAARTLADRNLVLTEAVQGNLDGFVAFRDRALSSSTIVPVAAGLHRCCGYSWSSRSQDGGSERRGSERSARCAERACPQHRCTPAATRDAALWNERFAANPRGYQNFLVDVCAGGIASSCCARLSFGHVDEQSTASSEKLAGEYRNYGRRKPDGCDAAETNTTPSWLIPSARGSAPRFSRRMKPRRPPAPAASSRLG